MLLEVENIEAAYGQSKALHGVTFAVDEGQILALLGRNGAGKTTTLRAIMGLSRITAGRVRFDGQDLAGWRTSRIARSGITLVPETRDPFNLLNVEENILLGYRKGSPFPMERLLQMFPLLKPLRHKMGGELSGGQQQLMAMARGLAVGPRLLLLDEPSQGLAPVMVNAVADVLAQLKTEKLTIVLVEQNLRMALGVADRVVVLEDGLTVESMTPAQAKADPDRLERFLAVG